MNPRNGCENNNFANNGPRYARNFNNGDHSGQAQWSKPYRIGNANNYS